MWVKIDDAILDNPKILRAGPEGFLLHVAAISWCGRNLTDGMIPKCRVSTLVARLGWLGTAIPAPPALGPEEDGFSPLDADEIADNLERCGLWHDRGDFWEIHDFLVYNPPRAKVLADRERVRTKKARQRMSPPLSPRLSPGDSQGDMCVCPALVPMPPVPVPVPVSGSSSPTLFPRAIQKPLARSGGGTGEPHRAVRGRPKISWPESLTLGDDDRAYAARNGLDAEYEWGKFKAHALRDDVRHVDWRQAWRYWCRNAWEFAQRRAQR